MRRRDVITGRTLGDFVVRDKLAEGGFGAVYRAEQPVLQREAVIKVLHTRLRESETLIQRFLREARLASQLDHPYAAHVYAFGVESDGLLWIAMELVRGTALDRLLRSQGPMPIERLAQLVDCLCEVVHTAHEQGIVHRDIKPANVIVLARAGRLLPKLLDFGIAKLAAGEAASRDFSASVTTDPALEALADTMGASSDGTPIAVAVESATQRDDGGLTHEGALVGSPRYMAPEQWVDPSAADARADIYSLGVLAYEALTGKPPYDAKSLPEVAIAHAEGAPPLVGDRFPPALDAVFACALAKRPEDRYVTALQLAAAFREAAGLAAETRDSLPQLDESLRSALVADAPQPLAEAVAVLAAAHDARQARDALRDLVGVAVRLVGIVAVACRTRVADAARDADAVIDGLRALRRRTLTDGEWLDLAREICRPFATQPDAFPVPELVTVFFDRADPTTERASPIADTLAMLEHVQRGATTASELRDLLAASLPGVARFLRSIAFLADYPLVAWHADRAELWMGIRRPKRMALAIAAREPLREDRPTLVDRGGRPVLSLWPLVQVASPSPGAAPEMFVFEGKGRHGARLVAMPADFERHDEALWEWFGDNLIDTADEGGSGRVLDDAPYRGLAPFTSRDAAMFFGREREVEAFVNRLRAQSLIAIVGPSGAGKSSFVQAGVGPALGEDWGVITVRPGPSPLAALAARLGHDGIDVDLVRGPPDALGDALRRHAQAAGVTIVLVIDQFEELFTLCADAEQRVRYADALVRAARTVEDPVRILITLRDDFLIAAEQLAPLRARLAHGLQLLSTPAREDLLRIVVEPARRAGYDFEDRELPAQMVDEVVDRPGALALLSFCAAELWQLRDRHFKQFGRRSYEAMGGVGGALAQHAETVLASLPAEEQRLVREAFRHLVTADGTRAVLARSELLQILGGGARAEAVLERLIAKRLVVAREGEGGEERVEVIHEALLVAWPRLVTWRREDAEGARLRDELRAAARTWNERGRPRGLLWRAETLTEYRLWRSRHPGALTDAETAFAAASVGDARRVRYIRFGLVVAAFAALVVGLGVLYRQNEETRRLHEVAEARGKIARENAAESKQRLVALYEEQGRQAALADDPMKALVALEQANREGAESDALHFLAAWAAQQLEGQIATFPETAAVEAIDITRAGDRVVTGGRDGHVAVWDVASGKRLHDLAGHTSELLRVRFDAEGQRIVTASADGVRIWNAATGAQLHSIDHGGPIAAVAVNDDSIVTVGGASTRLWSARDGSPRLTLPRRPTPSDDSIPAAIDRAGAHVAVGYRDGVVEVWRVADPKAPVRIKAHTGLVTRLTFSDDGSSLATAGFADGRARVWDVATGKAILEVVHPAPVMRSAVLSPRGDLFMSGGEDRTIRVTSMRTRRVQFAIESDSPPRHTSFDPTGTRMLTAHKDGAVRLWDTRTGAPIWSFFGHSDTVWAAAFDARGARLATASFDGSARVWDAAHTAHVALVGHTGDVWSTAFSRDGRRAATTAADGKAKIWELPSGKLIATIAAATKDYGAAVFSPDGTKVAVAGSTGASVFAANTGRRLVSLEGSTKTTYVAFAPAGSPLVAGVGLDGSVKLWDATTGRLVRALAGHTGETWYVTFDAQGKRLATASVQGAAIWDVETGARLTALTHPLGAWAIAFANDGKRVLTGSDDRLIYIWDAKTGEKIGQLEGHTSSVSTVDISPDDRFVLSSSHDGTVRVWDLQTRRHLVNLDVRTNGYFSAHYSLDGRSVITSSRDGAVKVWRLPERQLEDDELQKLVSCRVPARLHTRPMPRCDVQGDR